MSAAPNEPPSACSHPEAVGTRYGDPLSAERQAELQGYLDSWTAPGADHGTQQRPFDQVDLTGADVSWLAERSRRDMLGGVPNLHLEGANLYAANLEGADLRTAHQEGKMYRADDPNYTRVQRWAKDYPLTLSPADLRGAVLDAETTLKDITLGDGAHGAVRVADVRWGGTNLAVVDWTPLIEPRTELGDERAARLWQPAPFEPPRGKPSRQELRAARAEYEQEQAKAKLETFRAAVRANRQLATALRDQGMNEEADCFAYRAQVIQRQVFRQQGKRGRATLSWFLDRVAGHGYRPERSLYTYVGVILSFALLYLLAGNGLLTFGLPASQFHALPWYEALILSFSSFHGRGFFQPLQTPGDPVAIIASVEAIFGLFIEVSFIATFTQRFFGKMLACYRRHDLLARCPPSGDERATAPGDSGGWAVVSVTTSPSCSRRRMS